MSLHPGTQVGHYEVIAAVGAGGMGEVYRARDTKLNREVALKILPELFTADRDRVMRFEREAQTLAALNHPNIAQVYGVVEQPPALVMELVEGRGLDELTARTSRGGPMQDTLAIARQIADALEAAHERGIIHRDLKPANVKVRDDGTVKVLDFGLAKAITAPATEAAGPHAIAASPTFTSPAMTEVGLVLGTAAYMAPEQAKGKAVDKRLTSGRSAASSTRCSAAAPSSRTILSPRRSAPWSRRIRSGTCCRLKLHLPSGSS